MHYNGIEVYSTSMLHQFMSCQQKYQYRYERMRTHEGKAYKMDFGTIVHEGLATWYKTKDLGLACAALSAKGTELHLAATKTESSIYSIERAREVLLKYVDHYAQKGDVEVTMVEMPFLVEVEMGAGEEPFLYAGTIDGLAKAEDGEGFQIFENKTTGRLDSSYIASYRPNNQVAAYVWALSRYLAKPVYGAIINIVHVLTHETNFIRHTTPRLSWEIDRWEQLLKRVVRQVRTARASNEWTMNTSMCNNYGLCKYRTLCNAPPEHLEKFIQAEYVENIPGDLKWLFTKKK